jgi:two-component system chemotaxis sensor kinase CheA
MSIDFNELLPTFIEESLENIEEMEEALSKLDLKDIHAEDINKMFRSVHTIKGNSTIFKISAINDLAKTLENLLDNIRKKTLKMEKQHLDLLLKSSDCLRSMLLEIKKSGKTEGECAKALITAFIEANKNSSDSPKIETQTAEMETEKTSKENQGWTISFIPKADTLKRGNHPENIFRALKALGNLEISCDHSRCPEFSEFIPTECYLSWRLKLLGDVSGKDIQEILAWGTEESEVKLELLASEVLEKPAEEQISLAPAITSIRVATEKIDSLMNTAEALVLTESVLKQITKELGSKMLRKFSDNLEDLEQHSRRLQETILRMRMVPIAFAINRFPRMVLELSKQLEKEIEFKISGEQTEIDKTMVEKITDPLMHLIRNAIDHGIESPIEREKNKKKKKGSIELNSYQSGNNIIIDIKDDGAGLHAEKIRAVAIKKGLISKEKILADTECYQLIFQPGFSTAEAVTDISGRGVGLDVVMKNIHDLGGKVEVISVKNVGATFRLRLPLTLAIMDCQLIKVDTGFYAIPLDMIVEMRQLDESQVTLSSDKTEYYTLREEKFKLIHLDSVLFSRKEKRESVRKLLIKVKTGLTVFCLSCDELLFQQQIVVKSIEESYNKVPGILGATVLGSGELALILDVKEIERLAFDYMSIASKIVESSSVPVKTVDTTGSLNKEDTGQVSAEYLCFLLENIEYAFIMKDVKEVCVWQKYARLPFSPAFVRGIINLRGKIIPVVDPRVSFELNPQEHNFNNVIIILQVKSKEGNRYIGVIVDSITEMNTVRYDDIESQSKIENIKIKSCVRGVLDVKGKKIALLATECFVSFPEQKWSVS